MFINQAILYQIINTVTNRKYIGVTKRRVETRFIEHLSKLKNGVHSSKKMQNDYELYGRDKFKIEVIKVSDFNEICLLEKELTKVTYLEGYNVIIGGMDLEERGNAGRVFHDKLRKNPKLMENWVSNLSKWNKGKSMSEEARKKMSEKRKGVKWDDIKKKNRSILFSGSGNPNANNFSIYLNIETGIYYNTPDLLSLIGISKSCLISENLKETFL